MFLRYHSLDNYKPMNLIIEDQQTGYGLWLGDYTSAQDKTTLKSKNIRTVLTVASGLRMNHKTYHILDIESANIKKIWNDTYVQIDEGLQKGGVLVHCAAGVSRSASTVIAYIMRKRNWGMTETFNYVKKKRPVICPNFGFQRQLRAYERELNQSQTPTIKPQQQQQQQQKSEFKRFTPQQTINKNPLMASMKTEVKKNNSSQKTRIQRLFEQEGLSNNKLQKQLDDYLKDDKPSSNIFSMNKAKAPQFGNSIQITSLSQKQKFR